MSSGKWGCLGAVVAGGVGLTLVGLGFDSHTTEAMPFGAVLLLVGVIIGVPSLQALRGVVGARVQPFPKLLMFALLAFCVGLGLVGLGVQPRTTEALPFGVVTALVGLVLAGVSLLRGRTVEVQVAVGDPVIEGSVGKQPPTSVRCENCGSPAPLRLADPAHATCAHCSTRFALQAPLAAAMTAAAAVMRAQGEAERRIGDILKALPEKHLALRAQLRRSSRVLIAVAGFIALFGFLRRNVDDGWHGFLVFGLTSGVVSLVLGLWLGGLVPKVAQRIVGHWAALQVPGVEGLACRVCGGGLPSVAAPVLRCEYCGADSLAGPSVQALVAQQAGHAVRSVLSVAQRDSKADELAAFAVMSFPLITLVAWFAVGAFAGGAGSRLLSDLQLAPASSGFAVVRALRSGTPSVCAAARLERGGELELEFSGDVAARIPPAELLRYAIEPNVDARWFAGHRTNGMGKIDDVFSRLLSPNRVEASRGMNSLYFPYDGLGGEFICLDDVPAEGAALQL